ncbi:Protein T13B5.9, partial [Aphelenchoides avenae]
KGLLDAVRNLHDIVRVRKQEPNLDLKKLKKCYQPDMHWLWSLIVETAVYDFQVENASNDQVSMEPSWVIQEKIVLDMNDMRQLEHYGNYFLLVQVNEGECHKDPQLMAAASSCLFGRRSDASVPRPVLGHLVICLSSPTWQQFSSAYDLASEHSRHTEEERGFTATLEWNTNERSSPMLHQVQYMDFGHRATVFAREHFACQDLQGIEAEDAKATHMSEYIFGNELMTPVVSSGKNYFTLLSATILEDTYLGNT